MCAPRGSNPDTSDQESDPLPLGRGAHGRNGRNRTGDSSARGKRVTTTLRLCGCGGRTCTAAGTAYEAAALLLGDTASIGGPLENRTLRSLIASEARRPWNMAARDWWERTESNRLLLGFNETLEPFQLHSRGGVGASRTRSSPSRLIDVADRRLTVRPPLLELRSRRVPSCLGDTALLRSLERVRRLNERRRVPARRARTSRKDFDERCSFQRTRRTRRARPRTQRKVG